MFRVIAKKTDRTPPAYLEVDKDNCKITVIKTFLYEEWCKEMGREPKLCPELKEGQEFIVSNSGKIPKGICQVAWADIRFNIYLVHEGFFNSMIVCCSDSVRPVYFKLERIEA